jgi:glucuronosyltransferase
VCVQASVEELVEAVQQLLLNKIYKQTLDRASALFKELHGVPVQSAVYWLDHVMQHGGAYMRSSGQRMSLFQFLLLDVLALMTSVVVVVCCVVKHLCRAVCGRSGSRRKSMHAVSILQWNTRLTSLQHHHHHE